MSARYSGQSGYTVKRRAPVRRPGVQKANAQFKIGPNAAKFLGLAVLAILGAVMVSQSSSNATTAYKQTDLRNQTSQVDQDVERLKLEAKRAQSLQEVQDTPVKDGMVPADMVGRVEVGDVAGVSTAKP